MKIVFTGGGTAGHIFPIIAIVRELKKISPDKNLRLFYVGPNDGYALELLAQEGVKIKKVLTGKFRRYFSIKNLLDLFKIPIGILQAFFWFFFLAPDFVFSKGGYGSFPAVFAAYILRIPIFLHESDIVPGIASKIEGKWALEVFISFRETRDFFLQEKIIHVGNPVRKEIIDGSKEKAKEIFELKQDKPLILIMGGSQGAQSINNMILEILQEILFSFEVIHQTGVKNFEQVKAESGVILDKKLARYYHPFAFLNEFQLKHALAAADIVISRGGAGSLFEIAANEKPAILIPLPHSSQNHQLKNAYAFAREGGAEVMEEENLTPHFFLEKLKYYLSRQDILTQMAEGSSRFAKPKAANVVAFYLSEYIFLSLNSKKQKNERKNT